MYYNKKTAGNVFIKQVLNSGNYIITSKNGDEIGIFSVAAVDGENTIGNFIIYEKYRKTDVVKEAMLAMNDFFQKSQYEYLNCAVELDKPFLVRMYEKFGFEIKSIYSLNIKDTKHTLFELQKNGLNMK